jgi:MtN3 and saliva related transmembrane protein
VQPTSGLVESLGYAAGILTTIAFVPQLLKAWRSRSTGDLSLTMLMVFTIGLLLWLVYGAVLASWPILLSNAVTLGLTTPLLALKLREMSRPPHRPDRYAPQGYQGRSPWLVTRQ